MPVFKNEDNGTWYVMARYVNWKGERKQKCKRGFATKREAQEWERMFKLQTSSDLDMSFEAFTELYINDVKNRLKENTWLTKEHIIRTKILPYFGKLKISEISTKEIITWQNEMLAYRDEKKKPYSQTYLKTLHNQLSAIFNHAVRYYELRSNPAAKVGNMGREEHKEMLFWTKEEYKKFSFEMMDKPVSFYAFEMLYWCGIREGELLALTPADFNFDKETVTMNLLTSGKLHSYLAEVDKQAEDMFLRLVKEYADRQDVTEQLKKDNPYEWIGRMNNIQACVREVVGTELIYT